MPEVKLLPCPFCGCEDVELHVDETAKDRRDHFAYAFCMGCYATQGEYYGDSKVSEVTRDWNMRHYNHQLTTGQTHV